MPSVLRVDEINAAVGRIRSIIHNLDTDLVARRLAIDLVSTPIGRISGDGSQVRIIEEISRRSLEMVRSWLLSGQEPGPDVLSGLYEAVREAAQCGLLAEDVMRACSGALQAVRNALLNASLPEASAWPISQLDVPWTFVDVALSTVMSAFADQRDLPSAEGNFRAATLFARICSGSTMTIEDIDRAQRLGFQLFQPHCPFVAAIAGGSAAAHASLAARIRSTGALACAEGHRVAGLINPAFDWTGFLADRGLILGVDSVVCGSALGDAVGDLHDLVTLAERSGRRGRVRLTEFATEIMLAKSPRLAEDITHLVLSRLNVEDSSGTLTNTLLCLVQHNFNKTAAAAALPAHRNTLLYRISRIEKLSGLDLDRHAHREMARLAFVWRDTMENNLFDRRR
ncbi:helix-turn-helix domain-containing protein [Streptomyces sp. NPDC094468]|uniref:helix-turn-helix domain-containing protein n=1 Tax=Streptomyces sp. NPDC094468 TaxID=3366066 RepID=UPI003809DFC1